MLHTEPRYCALLIDLDGVLRRWPETDHVLEAEHGLPPGAIRNAAFDRLLLQRAVTGDLSDGAWRKCVAERLAFDFPGARTSDAVALWSEPIGELDTEVFALVRRVAEKLRVVVVTNGTTRARQDLDELGISPHLFAIVNSSEIGIAKPDSRVFFAALEAAGAAPRQALFVDDTASNVNVAHGLGIRSLRFSGAASLEHFFMQANLL